MTNSKTADELHKQCISLQQLPENNQYIQKLLPERASEQGNVIGLVSVYIYIYIYIYIYMSSKKNCN